MLSLIKMKDINLANITLSDISFINTAHAAGGGPSNDSAPAVIKINNPLCPNPPCNTDINTIVDTVTTGLLGIAIPICSIMILYSGWQFMSSAGDTKKVESAKQTIKYAVIGFIVILLAKFVVPLITNTIYG